MIRIFKLTFISLLLLGCNAKRITTEQHETIQKETVTNINPFNLSSIDTLVISDEGAIRDLRMELEYDNVFTAIATVKNNKLELNLKNMDTIKLTHIEHNTKNSTVQPVKIIAAPMPKWLRNLMIISGAMNLITLLYVGLKIYRFVLVPM